MALSGTLNFDLAVKLVKALDLATGTTPLSFQYAWTITNGTAANQADKIFHDSRSTAATDSLDMAGGLLDIYGDAFTPARIKVVAIKTAAANAAALEFTRPSAGVPILKATGDALILPAGTLFSLAAPGATGWVVTATTADLIDMVATSGTLAYDIAIIGASA